MKRSDFLVKSGLVGMGIVLYSNVISQMITNEITLTKVLSSGTIDQVRDQFFLNLPNHIVEITPGQALFINRNKQLTNVVASEQITLGKEQIVVLMDGCANVNGVQLRANEICYLPSSTTETQFAPNSRVLIFG
jgi:hypothetical protein